MSTPRLVAVDWTDAPAALNGLVRIAERRNLVSARVPSHFKRSLQSGDPLGTLTLTAEGETGRRQDFAEKYQNVHRTPSTQRVYSSEMKTGVTWPGSAIGKPQTWKNSVQLCKLSVLSKCLDSSNIADDKSKVVSFRMNSRDATSLGGLELCGRTSWLTSTAAEDFLWRKEQSCVQRSWQDCHGHTNTPYVSFHHDILLLFVAARTDCTSIQVTAYETRGNNTGCPTLL